MQSRSASKAAHRKTMRVIDVGRNGRPKRRWKQRLKHAFEVATKVMTAFVFVRNWGWKAFAGVFALGAALGAWLWPDDIIEINS